MAERLYQIQKAAELSGVSEELIRAWERRYRVVQPERTESGYRLYSAEDVELLKRLRELTEEGTPISQAARLVPDLRREIALEVEERAEQETEVSALERWRNEILRGAERMEQRRVERVLDDALSALPPLRVFDEVIVPTLIELGERWHAGAIGVAQEHLATQALRGRVLSLLHGAPEGRAHHVVCACVPEEQHEIGALGVALRFRLRGMRTTFLGQRTPASELGKLVKTLQPGAVALSAVTDPGRESFEAMLAELRREVPREVPLLLGGRAATLHRVPAARLGFHVFTAGGWDEAMALVSDG